MSDVISNLLINGLNPVTVGGTGTTLKLFPGAPGASIGVASTKTGYIYIPGNNELNCQRLAVRAGGNFILPGDAISPTVTLGVYISTNPFATSPTNTALFTSVIAAAGLGVTSDPWYLTMDFMADNTGGILQGSYAVQANDVAVATGTITSQSGIVMSAVTPFALAVGVTFSQSLAGNSASMYQFDLNK